jgi:hypothetical protein
MTDHLVALTKCIVELHQASLEVCHCIEEFFIRRIHPLGRWKTLTLKCPQMDNPYREPSEGCRFVLSPHC